MCDLNKLQDEKINLCAICDVKPQQYTCPKCSINYCSLNCYKSEKHEACSESFYKNCVEMEMKLQNYDPENKKKMLEILERLKLEAEEPSIVEQILNDEEEENEELDSDDDDSFLERLQNINLDNPDALWSLLTDAEKQEFEAIVQSSNYDEILPNWTPWWEQKIEERLVEELDVVPEYEKLCPTLITPPDIIGQMGIDDVKTDEEKIILSIKEAYDTIIEGPKQNCNYYVLAALSDLHALFSKARTEEITEHAISEFNKKFHEYEELDIVDISKKTMQLHLKKLEFYFSWMKLCKKNLYELESDLNQPTLN